MICKTCGEDKPTTEYYTRGDGKPDLHCKSCHLNRQRLHRQKPEVKRRESAWKRVYNAGRSEHRKSTHLMRTYGITEDQYKGMLNSQDNTCKICSVSFGEGKPACVDHCHDSGRVRGLLCHNCNKALGLFRDSSDTLLSAAKYLMEE